MFADGVQELRILGVAPHAEIGAAIALELQGRIYAPIHDLQGNVAAAVPLHEEELSLYRYNAFGEEQLTGPVLSPWRFSSKRTVLGLVCFGRRFYAPELGRWLTPDPAGFVDGMNLYAYVHNDPLSHFDEYGLLDWGQWDRNNKSESSPLPSVNRFMNSVCSHVAHELYGTLTPFSMLRDQTYGRLMNWLDPGVSRPGWQERMWSTRLAIDKEFGTNLAITGALRSEWQQSLGIRFTYGELPAPGGMSSSLANRVSSVAKKSIFSQSSLSGKNATQLVQTTDRILFGQKTVSAFFQNRVISNLDQFLK